MKQLEYEAATCLHLVPCIKLHSAIRPAPHTSSWWCASLSTVNLNLDLPVSSASDSYTGLQWCKICTYFLMHFFWSPVIIIAYVSELSAQQSPIWVSKLQVWKEYFWKWVVSDFRVRCKLSSKYIWFISCIVKYPDIFQSHETILRGCTYESHI
jgi:hypothetical protein